MSKSKSVHPSSDLGFSPFIGIERRRRNVQEETRPLWRERDPIGNDQEITKPTVLEVVTIEDE
jgi:hypothetical protein